MTNNIEKLYELAGVERIYSEFNNGKETVVERVFSHYKQLELIKWIAINNNTHTILSIDKLNNQTRLSIDKNKYDVNLEEYDYSSVNNDFSQALAGLVCELWEDLTDEQKAEIKRILE